MKQYQKITHKEIAWTLRIMSLAIQESKTLEEFRKVFPDFCQKLHDGEQIQALGDQIAVKLYGEVITNGGYNHETI